MAADSPLTQSTIFTARGTSKPDPLWGNSSALNAGAGGDLQSLLTVEEMDGFGEEVEEEDDEEEEEEEAEEKVEERQDRPKVSKSTALNGKNDERVREQIPQLPVMPNEVFLEPALDDIALVSSVPSSPSRTAAASSASSLSVPLRIASHKAEGITSAISLVAVSGPSILTSDGTSIFTRTYYDGDDSSDPGRSSGSEALVLPKLPQTPYNLHTVLQVALSPSVGGRVGAAALVSSPDSEVSYQLMWWKKEGGSVEQHQEQKWTCRGGVGLHVGGIGEGGGSGSVARDIAACKGACIDWTSNNELLVAVNTHPSDLLLSLVPFGVENR